MSWGVQVWGGVAPDADLLARALITRAADLTQEIPTTFGPVEIETVSPGSISMWGTPEESGGVRALHVMENVWHVRFLRFGHLDIEGVERRSDGVLVHSRWEVAPYVTPSEREALIESILGPARDPD